MAFTVHFTDGTLVRYADEGARFAIRDNAVLKVEPGDRCIRLYSPAAWSWIEDEGASEGTRLEW